VSPPVAGIALRFSLGAAGGALAALAAFGRATFAPGEPAFESLTLALVAAALHALVRAGRGADAIVLVPAYGLLRLGLGGWQAGLGALGLATGALVVAFVFDELARVGVRFGKFLIVGPLLGGACLAVAPFTMYSEIAFHDSLRPLMLQLFLGVVVGDGIGLGVELAELLPWTERPAVVVPAGGVAADPSARTIQVVDTPAEHVDWDR
jgi:hypothetical protein